MKWLLLVIVADVNGEFTVNVMSAHDTMAGCHVAGTYINWEERMPVNKEMLCFPSDVKIEVN